MLNYDVVHAGQWGYDLTADQVPMTTVQIKVPVAPGSMYTNDYSKDYRYEIIGDGHTYLEGVIKFANRHRPCYWVIDHIHRVPMHKSVVSDMLRRTVQPDSREYLVQGVLILRDALLRLHGRPHFKPLMDGNRIDGQQGVKVDLSRFKQPGVDPRVKKFVRLVSHSDGLD